MAAPARLGVQRDATRSAAVRAQRPDRGPDAVHTPSPPLPTLGGRGRSRRPTGPQRRPAPVPPSPIHLDHGEIERATGGPGAPRFERKLREAARAFDMERFDEALPKLRALAHDTPGAARYASSTGSPCTGWAAGRTPPASSRPSPS